MLKLIKGFIEKNPEFMWKMMEGDVPKAIVVGNIDGTPLNSSQIAVLELTTQLNALHTGTGLGSDGAPPHAVDTQVPNQE